LSQRTQIPITGVVITSATEDLPFAGGDLKGHDRDRPGENAGESLQQPSESIKADCASWRPSASPFVAASTGAALGGGLEIALATHHRIAADAEGQARSA